MSVNAARTGIAFILLWGLIMVAGGIYVSYYNMEKNIGGEAPPPFYLKVDGGNGVQFLGCDIPLEKEELLGLYRGVVDYGKGLAFLAKDFLNEKADDFRSKL